MITIRYIQNPSKYEKISVSIYYIQRGQRALQILCKYLVLINHKYHLWFHPKHFPRGRLNNQSRVSGLVVRKHHQNLQLRSGPTVKKKILHKQTEILPNPYISVVKSLQIILRFVVALSQRQAA